MRSKLAHRAPFLIVATTPPVAERVPNVKVAYIMSRFPKLNETFIRHEITALEKQGMSVEIYPLLRERPPLVQPEAEALVRRAHYHPFLSWRILLAHWHFMCRRPRAYVKVLAEVLGGTWGSLNFFIGALGVFPKAVRFAYEMAAQDIAHVHAHFSNHPAVAALIIHRLIDIPFSYTAHGHDIHIERRMLAHKTRAAAFAVTISSYNKRLMIEECGAGVRDKIHIIHCGIDPEVFVPRADFDRAGRFTIVCVGSLLEVKGQTYLIEACRLLKQRGVDCIGHLVGTGPDRRKLAVQIAKAGLQDRVFLHGPRSQTEVADMLSRADVMALPSVPTPRGSREGIPVALMEAMASGLPVVASRISGIPELVEAGRTGLLTLPRDATAVADALQELSADADLRRRLGQAGREKVLREFTVHRSAARLAHLFLTHGHQSRQRRPSVDP